MKKYILVMMVTIFSTSFTFAQVGINTDQPDSNTGLHVSERKNPASTTPDKYNGIIIQRYTETERNTNLTPNMGLGQNSLMIYNTTEDCYNYWNNSEQQWKSICGNLGNAKFTFNCSDLSLKGNYVKGKETDGSHYIEISIVNVTRAGSYQISASSNPSNGYSFVGQGIFTTTGAQKVRLYAQGIPLASQTDAFSLTSSGSTSQTSCIVSANVQPDIASYTLNCSTVSVFGTYRKGIALTSSNYITINTNVSTVGSYRISTTTLNGVTFSASGVFVSVGNQSITLQGAGSPTVNTDFDVTISSNTIAGNATCSATIPLTMPAMTYAVIGANNVYSWHPNNIRAEAFNSTSFGPSGKVRMVSFTNLWNTNSATAAVTNLNGVAKPDVVLYYSFGLSITPQLATALNDYVNAGGVLIFGTADDDTSGTNILLNGLFGQGNAQQQIAGTGSSDDNVYMVNNLQNDPIVNGPFGNTAGKYWGEDNSSTGSIIVTSLPANSIQIAPASNQFSKYTVNPAYSTVWYSNAKNFVYFGDSVGASESSLSELEYPAFYNNGVPLTKRYGQWPNNASQAQFIYNSILELNAVAWAIKKAATSGINPH